MDTYFTCQQTRDTRFLMKQVTQGRCEMDYVCFEFLPRHQNVIRFRMGRLLFMFCLSIDRVQTFLAGLLLFHCWWKTFHDYSARLLFGVVVSWYVLWHEQITLDINTSTLSSLGKPYQVVTSEVETPESLQRIFKLACSWSAFTVSRTENLNYVYQTFIREYYHYELCDL